MEWRPHQRRRATAVGTALGTLFGFEPHTTATYAFALGFTFAGAVVVALGRFRDRLVPQEAIIGTGGVLPDLLLDLVVDLLGVLR